MFLIMKASQQGQHVELMGQMLGRRGVRRPAGSWPVGQAVALVRAGRDQPQNTVFGCLWPGWSWSSRLRAGSPVASR